MIVRTKEQKVQNEMKNQGETSREVGMMHQEGSTRALVSSVIERGTLVSNWVAGGSNEFKTSITRGT